MRAVFAAHSGYTPSGDRLTVQIACAGRAECRVVPLKPFRGRAIPYAHQLRAPAWPRESCDHAFNVAGEPEALASWGVAPP